MEIITMILSGLALLAAVLCLILILREKKRNEKRNAAMADLFCIECSECAADIRNYLTDLSGNIQPVMDANAFRLQKMIEILQSIAPVLNAAVSTLSECKGRIENLEQGIVPDYNEALQAKKSVDLFNEGIANILNYNPMEAARKAREERQFGGRVE